MSEGTNWGVKAILFSGEEIEIGVYADDTTDWQCDVHYRDAYEKAVMAAHTTEKGCWKGSEIYYPPQRIEKVVLFKTAEEPRYV